MIRRNEINHKYAFLISVECRSVVIDILLQGTYLLIVR